jgi:DNA-binding LacI/PurR family transcriptional regulator
MHSGLHGRPVEDIHAKLRDGRVDGLILHADADDPLVAYLEHSSLPVVVIADPVDFLPSVTSDDIGGMNLALDYLWNKGYRRFAYLAPEHKLGSVVRRQHGFEHGLRSRGLAPDERKIINIEWEEVTTAIFEQCDLSKQTAICCWNDRTAYRFLTLCLRNGIKIPEQIAVVGFDGFIDEKAPSHRLVTVRCPWPEVVDKALEILMELVSGDITREEACAQQFCLPVSMIDGDTA